MIYDRKIKCCELLRRALLLINSISYIKTDSKEKEKSLDYLKMDLYKRINDIMKNKLKELNPDFDEIALNQMIKHYNRVFAMYPIDIIVIDKAVFHTEGILDESLGFIYEINTHMFKNSKKPYHNIFDEDFVFDTENM